MVKFYSNENFPIPVVLVLRALGHDVVTIQDRGRASESVSDPEVLSLAVAEGRAVLTLNRKDFIQLHHQNPHHEGIVVCTVDRDFPGQAARIHHAVANLPNLKGQLIRVNRPSS